MASGQAETDSLSFFRRVLQARLGLPSTDRPQTFVSSQILYHFCLLCSRLSCYLQLLLPSHLTCCFPSPVNLEVRCHRLLSHTGHMVVAPD